MILNVLINVTNVYFIISVTNSKNIFILILMYNYVKIHVKSHIFMLYIVCTSQSYTKSTRIHSLFWLVGKLVYIISRKNIDTGKGA